VCGTFWSSLNQYLIKLDETRMTAPYIDTDIDVSSCTKLQLR